MNLRSITWTALAVVAFALPLNAAEPTVTKFLNQHCLDCHQGDAAEASFVLDDLLETGIDRASLLEWRQIHQRVERHEMPPAEMEQPTAAERKAFVDALRQELTAIEQSLYQQEGRSALRRLNRYEYQNTLREILALPHLNVLEILPPDGSANGFDKSAEALDISHVHVVKWMEAADFALQKAIAPTPLKPEPKLIRAEVSGVDETRKTCQGFYSMLRQGRAIPMNGMQPDETLEINLGDFAAQDSGDVVDLEPQLDGLAVFINGESNLGMTIRPFRVELPGYYTLRVHGYGITNQLGKIIPTDRVETVGFYTDDRTLGYCDLPSYKPTTAEITVWLNAGDNIKPLVASSTYPVIRAGGQGLGAWKRQRGNGVVFNWMEMEGPFYEEWPPQSHQRLFGEQKLTKKNEAELNRRERRFRDYAPVDLVTLTPKNADQQADELLSEFASRALRRPVTESDLEVPRSVYREKTAAGASYAEGLLAAYRAILTSPAVVLLNAPKNDDSQFDIATRLAYFLWSSPPDELLLNDAAQAKLSDESVLLDHVERMLEDPRSERFVTHFLDHWLMLKDIELTEPDENLYPEYNPLLLDSMIKETRGYFATLVRGNLGVKHIVDSDFSVLNQRLAEHYGIAEVTGTEMRRVELPEDCHRGGLLTHAAVLKTTANGTTTSPVTRGTFVMSQILGDPPPPPPASVPAVEPDISGATTIREQLAQHRSDPACAGCHQKIDPPGFALESFDVMGGYRERYRSLGQGDRIRDLFLRGGQPARVSLALPVDASGDMPGSGEFQTIEEFKRLLAQRERQLAENLLRQLVVYATGTPVSFADEAEFNAILNELEAGEFGIRDMMKAVATSRMFLDVQQPSVETVQ